MVVQCALFVFNYTGVFGTETSHFLNGSFGSGLGSLNVSKESTNSSRHDGVLSLQLKLKLEL